MCCGAAVLPECARVRACKGGAGLVCAFKRKGLCLLGWLLFRVAS